MPVPVPVPLPEAEPVCREEAGPAPVPGRIAQPAAPASLRRTSSVIQTGAKGEVQPGGVG